MREKKTLKIISIAALIIGAFVLAVDIIISVFAVKACRTSVKIEATIDRIEYLYDEPDGTGKDVYVSYVYDGIEYKDIRLNYYSSSMKEGKKINVRIDPKNPSHLSAYSVMWILCIVLSVLGLVFFLIGLISTIVRVSKEKKNKQLRTDGRRIIAKIVHVDKNTHVRVNNKYPFFVECSFTDEFTGQVSFFKSHNVWDGRAAKLEEGSDIYVYVDRNDPETYVVDVERAIQETIHGAIGYEN